MIVTKVGHGKWWVEQLVFSPDGAHLAAPRGVFGVYLVPAFGGDAGEPVPLPSASAGRVVFHPDGAMMYCGYNRPCAVRLADRSVTVLRDTPWVARTLGVSSDGSRLVIGESSRDVTFTRLLGRYLCFDAADPTEPLWTVEFEGSVESPPMFPPGGDRFVTSEWRPDTRGRSLRARSVATGAELPDPPTPCGYVSVLSPDGLWAAGVANTWVHVYPAPGNPRHGKAFKNDGRRLFTDIAFHPSGKDLAATSNDRSVKLFDTESGKPAKAFEWNVGRLRSVAFSPDGLRAAVGSDTGQVVVWDLDL